MKKGTSKELIDTASARITEDRERLEFLYARFKKILEDPNADPMLILQMSESITKIADSLSKQTFQLIEMAKVRQRTEMIKSKSKENDDEMLNEMDQISIYDQLEEKVN